MRRHGSRGCAMCAFASESSNAIKRRERKSERDHQHAQGRCQRDLQHQPQHARHYRRTEPQIQRCGIDRRRFPSHVFHFQPERESRANDRSVQPDDTACRFVLRCSCHAGLLRITCPQSMCVQSIHCGDAGEVCGQCDHDNLDNGAKFCGAIVDGAQFTAVWRMFSVSDAVCDSGVSSTESGGACATLSHDDSGAGVSTSLQWSQLWRRRRRWWKSRHPARYLHSDRDRNGIRDPRGQRPKRKGDSRRKLTGSPSVGWRLVLAANRCIIPSFLQ